jgi:lipid II:glycine glycyltransferase (peptidoglycan interpeptide bridge formation enzyme)
MHFEQSNEWARFQQAVGRRVFMISSSTIAPFAEGKRMGEGEGVAVERKMFGPFRYLEINGWALPAGDVHLTAGALQKVGNKAHVVCVRWTPPWEIPNPKSQIPDLKDVDIIEPKILAHQVPPKATLVIDLSKDEEEILKKMHEKTRYNIRLAERKGVAVNKVDVQEGFEKFWGLMRETAQRDKIGIHQKEYYRKMLEAVQGEEVRACLFIATFEGVPLATAILIVCGDTATYLHGGSSSEQRNLMGPHLLQWRMMQFAKAQGCRWYDMWGIAPQTQNSKLKTQNYGTWAGITRFKMGFGGEVREGAGTFDIVCRPVPYRVLSLGRQMKDIIR